MLDIATALDVIITSSDQMQGVATPLDLETFRSVRTQELEDLTHQEMTTLSLENLQEN